MVLSLENQAIDRIEQRLAEKIGARRFQLWFKNSARLDWDEQRLCVQVPNNWVGGWIENNFTNDITTAVQEATGLTPAIAFQVNTGLFPSVARTAETQANAKRVPSFVRERRAVEPVSAVTAPPIGGRRKLRYELDKFVVGSGNRMAYSAIRVVADQVTSRFNPLFIHGGCGLGKTHLLQGLCNELTRQHPNVGWKYVSGEEFTNQFIVAVKAGSLDAFRKQYRNVDVLVIDDVHFLANKRATQEEFLHTYNAIDAAGKQVVMASDAHPRLIGDLPESLVDRFISGMVVEVAPLDAATRRQILQVRATEYGIEIPDAVADRMSAAIEGNVRELEGAIMKLLAYSQLCGESVNMSIAERVIRECSRGRNAAVQLCDIEQRVAEFFGVTSGDIRCSKRTRLVASARAVAMYLARKHTPMSFPEIGRALGNKNHSTVVLACQKIEHALKADLEMAIDESVGGRSMRVSRVVETLEEQLGCSKSA